MLCQDVEAYVKGYNVCLASNAVCHKPYGNLQSLPILAHQWKDLSIDFIIDLLVSANYKSDSYDSIIVIVDRLTKMVHYILVKITIDASSLAKVIIDMLVYHHGVSGSFVTN